MVGLGLPFALLMVGLVGELLRLAFRRAGKAYEHRVAHVFLVVLAGLVSVGVGRRERGGVGFFERKRISIGIESGGWIGLGLEVGLGMWLGLAVRR